MFQSNHVLGAVSTYLMNLEPHVLVSILLINFLFTLKKYRVKYVFDPYNISTFCISLSKIFLQLLIPIQFSTTTFGTYF